MNVPKAMTENSHSYVSFLIIFKLETETPTYKALFKVIRNLNRDYQGAQKS